MVNFGKELSVMDITVRGIFARLQAGREAVSANRTSLPIKASYRAGHLSWRPHISERAFAARLNA